MNESEVRYSLPIQREIAPDLHPVIGLCPWCLWKLDLSGAGWYSCGQCGHEFYCADMNGTYMEYPNDRWLCFHPRLSRIVPKGTEFEASPLTKDTPIVTAHALSPSAFADLRKYWKHGHIILWKRLRMHARRWRLLKD